MDDIQPYMCPFDQCRTPNVFYAQKDALVKHWKTYHTEISKWKCGLCIGDPTTIIPDSLFESKEDFEKHLRSKHQDSLFEEDLPAMVEISRTQDMLIPVECPVCLCELNTSDPAEDNVDHICACLHDFSLRSLWNDRMPMADTTCVKGKQLRTTCATCGRYATRVYRHSSVGVDLINPDPNLFCACLIPPYDVNPSAS